MPSVKAHYVAALNRRVTIPKVSGESLFGSGGGQVGFFQKLRSWFGGSTTPRDPDTAFEQLPWLEPHENPFGVRLLDCRPVAESFLSLTQDPRSISFFGSPESRSGEQFRGEHPLDAMRVACDLAYPLTEALPEGPVFLAAAMEDKWNIYHFTEALYFARSWTGQLQYVARLTEAASQLRVIEVEAFRGNVLGVDQLAVRQVDYLIKSHVFGQLVPHPVPPLASKKGLAVWSFSQCGRRGLFAVPEAGWAGQSASPTL
jgi:hypothetical protein